MLHFRRIIEVHRTVSFSAPWSHSPAVRVGRHSTRVGGKMSSWKREDLTRGTLKVTGSTLGEGEWSYRPLHRRIPGHGEAVGAGKLYLPHLQVRLG